MRAIANPEASIEEFLRSSSQLGLRLEREEAPLSRFYEAAAAVKEAEERGAVLLFRVKEYSYEFIANLMSSRRVLYRSLGAARDKEAYEKLAEAEKRRGVLDYVDDFGDYFEAIDGGLKALPALRFFEKDGGMYITSSIFVACRGRTCNASIHRIMVREDYAAVRVVPRHLYALLRQSGGSMPVAVVIGVDPRVLLASALSPPLGVFELEIAARLVGGSLKVCQTPLYGLPVPCGASMVVEATLGPERAPEGPFTDLLGLYDTVRNEPVLHVQRVYINKKVKPLIHVILPGGLEHMLLMGFPREAAIYSAVARAVPRVHKVRLTQAGGMWLHAVVSISKSHDGDGKTAGMAALSAHPSLKHVVVVDEDIDPDKPGEVEWAIATRLQADRGLVVIPAARGSTLDPSARDGLTTKLLVDATAPLGEREKYIRPRIPSSRF